MPWNLVEGLQHIDDFGQNQVRQDQCLSRREKGRGPSRKIGRIARQVTDGRRPSAGHGPDALDGCDGFLDCGVDFGGGCEAAEAEADGLEGCVAGQAHGCQHF